MKTFYFSRKFLSLCVSLNTRTASALVSHYSSKSHICFFFSLRHPKLEKDNFLDKKTVRTTKSFFPSKSKLFETKMQFTLKTILFFSLFGHVCTQYNYDYNYLPDEMYWTKPVTARPQISSTRATTLSVKSSSITSSKSTTASNSGIAVPQETTSRTTSQETSTPQRVTAPTLKITTPSTTAKVASTSAAFRYTQPSSRITSRAAQPFSRPAVLPSTVAPPISSATPYSRVTPPSRATSLPSAAAPPISRATPPVRATSLPSEVAPPISRATPPSRATSEATLPSTPRTSATAPHVSTTIAAYTSTVAPLSAAPTSLAPLNLPDAETAPLLTAKFSRQSEYERGKDQRCFLSYNLRKYFYFTIGALVGGVIVIVIGICIHFTLKHCKRRQVTASVSSNVLLTAHTNRNDSSIAIPIDIPVEDNSYLEPIPSVKPKSLSLPPPEAPPKIPDNRQTSSEPVRLPTKSVPQKKPLWYKKEFAPAPPPPLTPDRKPSCSLPKRQDSPDPWKTAEWVEQCSITTNDSFLNDEDMRAYEEDAEFLLTLQGNAVRYHPKNSVISEVGLKHRSISMSNPMRVGSLSLCFSLSLSATLFLNHSTYSPTLSLSDDISI